MDTDRVSNEVRKIVSDILSVEECDIDDGELLTSYGLSSIDLLDVVVKLEQKYNIRFDPKKMSNLSCRRLSENISAGLTAL